MINPHLETADKLYTKIQTSVPVPYEVCVAAVQAQALLAIAFEMNRFNNFAEEQAKIGGAFHGLTHLKYLSHLSTLREMKLY
jgi:hypothetical protein